MLTPGSSPSLTVAGAIWTFLAALGGAAIPLSVMWVKLQLDQLSARCDAVAKLVEETAELSLNYWLTGDQRTGSISTALARVKDPYNNQLLESLVRHEIKIRGAQAILQLDVARLSRDMPRHIQELLSEEFREFISAITGDRFQDRDGFTEPEIAQRAVTASARLVRVIRSGRDSVSSPINLLMFLLPRFKK